MAGEIQGAYLTDEEIDGLEHDGSGTTDGLSYFDAREVANAATDHALRWMVEWLREGEEELLSKHVPGRQYDIEASAPAGGIGIQVARRRLESLLKEPRHDPA